MFASESPTRLDLGITVGPENPDDIKSILSSPLPSLADYTTHGDIARKALSRLCTTLEHHHYRAREIFRGTSAGFDKFFGVTNHPFPMLESRSLFHKFACEVKFQTPFLGDLSDLHHLRRLRLEPFFPHSYPDLFHPQRLSLTSFLKIDTTIGPWPEMSLVCLQGTTCLRHLDLAISHPPCSLRRCRSILSTPAFLLLWFKANS